jgi:hypothetical protein
LAKRTQFAHFWARETVRPATNAAIVVTMVSTRGERLRAARTKRFRSARSAAKALGIPLSTYGAHERAEWPGGRDYNPEQAQRYAQRFGVTPEWLLTGRRQSADDAADVSEQPKESTTTKSPIIGYIGVDAKIYFYAVSLESLDVAETPRLVTASTVALEIHGNSLGFYLNHCFVLYDDVRRAVTPNLIGELCVIGLKDGRTVVKQLQEGGARGKFDLISHGAPPVRNAGVEWASIVKAVVQR